MIGPVSFAETAKLLMVSFDLTVKANLSVGLPLDMVFYERDSLRVALKKRIGVDDPYYRTVSEGWSKALKAAFEKLPDFEWSRTAIERKRRIGDNALLAFRKAEPLRLFCCRSF
jgi:predicted proteasome-type protease